MAHTKVFLKKAGSIFIGNEKKSKKKEGTTLSNVMPILTVLVEFLEKQGREIEGLFRVNGSLSELNSLKDELISRSIGELTPEANWDPHVVAGLIKLLLRELEEPLLMFSLYDHLLSALDVKEGKAQLQVMKAIIDSLPKENRSFLFNLMHLFYLISRNENITKMSAHNLAVVMGPTIMRPSGESFDTMMSDSSKVVSVVTVLIDNVEYFCKGSGESITIISPVNLNEQEMGQLVPLNSKVEKRDLRKKYDELKKSHRELLQNFDELRTQYSVLEAYSAKIDLKVNELEDLLESMEHPLFSRKESDTNINNVEEENELNKLRNENECLREVLIRATREDVANLREDTTNRIKSPRELVTREDSTSRIKTFSRDPLTTQSHQVPLPVPVPIPTLLPKRFSASSLNTVEPEVPGDSIERTNSRKSVKITNTFIRKQGSAKIIQKIKSHKTLDTRKALETTGNTPTLSSASDPKKTQNTNDSKPAELSNIEFKFPITTGGTLRSRRSAMKLTTAEEGKTLTSSSASSRNVVPPILSPGKVTRQNTISSSFLKSKSDVDLVQPPLTADSRLNNVSGDKESQKENHREIHNKENMVKRKDSNRAEKDKDKELTEILTCLQKMIELEQNITKETEIDFRKQMEDVRGTLSLAVGSLTHLSQKLCL